MANTFVGIGVLWAFPGGPASTLTGLGVLTQLQSLEFETKAQKEKIVDGTGSTSAVGYLDPEDNVTLDFIITSGTNTGSLTVTAVPQPGSTLAITDSNFTPISKTFLVNSCPISRANSKAAMAKLDLSRYINNSLPS